MVASAILLLLGLRIYRSQAESGSQGDGARQAAEWERKYRASEGEALSGLVVRAR